MQRGLCLPCRGIPFSSAASSLEAHNEACASHGERSYPDFSPEALKSIKEERQTSEKPRNRLSSPRSLFAGV